MTSSTSSLHIAYTAPDSPDVGQQTASVVLDGPTLAIDAVCQTELVIKHPAGQRLRLEHAGLRADENSDALVVLLPPEELQFDLAVIAEPSGAAGRIILTTKKEGSKPDPIRRASLRA